MGLRSSHLSGSGSKEKGDGRDKRKGKGRESGAELEVKHSKLKEWKDGRYVVVIWDKSGVKVK